jgi:hypothetical protein
MRKIAGFSGVNNILVILLVLAGSMNASYHDHIKNHQFQAYQAIINRFYLLKGF